MPYLPRIVPCPGGLQGSLASIQRPPHPICFVWLFRLRWVEPVFVQISYNGKVLVERTKIFPNGSQRKHTTVLAEKKAHGKCVDFDLLIVEARS